MNFIISNKFTFILTKQILKFKIYKDKKQKAINLKQQIMKTASNLDTFLKQIKASNYYCQPISITLKFQNIEQISIKLPQTRDHEMICKFPEIKFSLSEEIVTKLTQDIMKSRKSRNGLIAAYENVRFKHKMQKIHYFSQNDEDDIGVWQEAEDAFCVGFVVQKEGNYEQFRKRVTVELKKCLQKKLQQVVYLKNTQSHDSLSELNPIQKIMYKHFRFFLIYEPLSANSLLVNRIMYYPDSKFLIKPIKLVPSKFTANKVYEEVLNFKSKYDYGYLSLSNNSKTKQIRFLLIDKFDPQLNQSPPPMIGVWLSAQKFQSKEEMKSYFWAVIMEYLRNPSLKIKLSINYQNTGLLFTIEKPQKITAYIFQIIDQPKWNIKYSSENTFKLPDEYIFNDQEVIIQEDKEESDIQSIQNRSIMKSNQFFNSYLPENAIPTNSNVINGSSGNNQYYDLSKSSVENKSVLSNDQKDLEIKFLKKQLEFYKNRCDVLQKMINNPTVMQIQAMQMLNPLANHLANPLAFNNMMYQSLHQNNFQNQQMGFMQQNSNPNMNMLINNQNNIPQNQILYQSRASKNIQKNLNQSDLYEEQQEKVPEPVTIQKQLAFNKKKTFEQQKITAITAENHNLMRKQSCPSSFTAHQQTNLINKVQLGQFPSEENIQMSPNAKKHNFQYDYKNISFQDNSFDNDLNTTHKFAQFESNQSQIFGKSPDFKPSFNFNNQNSEKQNNFRISDVIKTQIQKQSKNPIPYNMPEFSFDRREDDFLSSKNLRHSPEKNPRNFTTESAEDRHDSEDSEQADQRFINKFQMKYNSQLTGKNQNGSKKNYKKQAIEETYNKKERQPQQNKLAIKYSGARNSHKIQDNKISNDKPDRLRSFEGKRQIEPKKTQKIEKEQEIKYGASQNKTKFNEQVASGKSAQNAPRKQQLIQSFKTNKSPAPTKARQPIQNSDSESDEELRNIAMKYKK